MANTGACKPCCVRQLDCEACERCLPKYICVDMEITPGPYTELTSCCGEDYGIGHASFRLPFDGSGECATWSGSGGCPDISSIDIKVRVEQIYGECKTFVSSSLLDEELEFTGILPNDMIFGIETQEGDEIVCSISVASMVAFPLAFEKCSPCACTRCMPAKLCAVVSVEGDAYTESVFESGSVEYDCETNRWSGSVSGYDIVISQKPIDEKICGLDVSINGPAGTAGGEIILEDGIPDGTMGGTTCVDSTGAQFVQGEILGNPGPQSFASLISGSFTLVSDYPDSEEVGTVTITDQSCGECLPCQESPTQAFQTQCCVNPTPAKLHCTITSASPNCTAMLGASGILTGFLKTTNPDVYQWEGPVGCINVQLECSGNPPGWHLQAFPPLTFDSDITALSCDPIAFSSTLGYTVNTSFPESALPCCPVTLPPGNFEVFTLTFTITQ